MSLVSREGCGMGAMSGEEWVTYAKRAGRQMIEGLDALDLSVYAEELRRAATGRKVRRIFRELKRRGVLDEDVYGYIRKDAAVMRYYILAYIYDEGKEKLIF